MAGGARITPYRDGPYLVRGEFELLDQDGEPIERRRGTVALCRCGASRTKPFCDGTHKTIGFRSPGGAGAQPLRPGLGGNDNGGGQERAAAVLPGVEQLSRPARFQRE